MDNKSPITIEDLDLIFFRAQDADGRWGNVSVKDATDTQFDTWAKSRKPVVGEDGPWSLVERAQFCDGLWQAGALSMLKRNPD
jgi:hypothetical protein